MKFSLKLKVRSSIMSVPHALFADGMLAGEVRPQLPLHIMQGALKSSIVGLATF